MLLINRDIKLDDSDRRVMQDYMDMLAEKCETTRVLIWDHPVTEINSQEPQE